MTEEEYRQSRAVSQSQLTLLDSHPNLLKKELDGERLVKDSNELKIGNLVDHYLTSNEPIDKYYVTIDPSIIPTGKIKELLDAIYNDYLQGKTYEFEYYYNLIGFKRDSLEKIKKRFEKEAGEYWTALTSGKTPISLSVKERSLEIVDSLSDNTYTSKWVKNSGNTKYQFKIFGDFRLGEGIPIKGMLDICHFEGDTIYPVDIKCTTYSLNYFDSTIFSKRYDLQADLYWYLLYQNYPGYNIAPFRFVVENMDYPGTPLVYKYNYRGVKDREYNSREYKGIDTLMEEYKFHIERDIWSYKKEDVLNDGEREI